MGGFGFFNTKSSLLDPVCDSRIRKSDYICNRFLYLFSAQT